MKKRDRLQLIATLINDRGEVSVTELENELRVSQMTIRRDLDTLDERGLIIRTHGGATSLTFGQNRQLDYSQRMELHLKEKLAVAKAAATQIQDNDIIFLGPGTTIELMVDFITAQNVQIVTSSNTVFDHIRKIDRRFRVIITGGIYDPDTGSFNGPLSYATVAKLQFDKAFIGVNGINNFSVSNYNIEAGELQNMVLLNSSKRFIVSDMHKFNTRAFFDFYTLQPGDYIVTNNQLTDSVKKEYAKLINFVFTTETVE
ncbi:TPA: DeoR/GlpR family DNA-binding transcription regulator [Enterococcus faecalis]